MIATLTHIRRFQTAFRGSLRRIRPGLSLFTLLILFPAFALSQSPFDTGFTAMQTLFTGTVAKVASLIAIVVGGYQFAHGEPGAKKSCPSSVETPLDTTHAVETVPEEFESTSNRQ
jgi:type IV secretion system protein VirB2